MDRTTHFKMSANVKSMRIRFRLSAFLTLSALACLPAQSGFAADDDERPEWSFVPGRYTLIGRHPDS